MEYVLTNFDVRYRSPIGVRVIPIRFRYRVMHVMTIVLACLAFAGQAAILDPAQIISLHGTLAPYDRSSGESITVAVEGPPSATVNGQLAFHALITVSVWPDQRNVFFPEYQIVDFADDGSGFVIAGLSAPGAITVFPFFAAEADFVIGSPGDVTPTRAAYDGLQTATFLFDRPIASGQSSVRFYTSGAGDLTELGPNGAALLVRSPAGNLLDVPFDSYITFIPVPDAGRMLVVGLLALVVGRVRHRSKLVASAS